MRVAMYVRVSRLDQQPGNQILELRRYVAARGWEAREFVERGVSGATDRRSMRCSRRCGGGGSRWSCVGSWTA